MKKSKKMFILVESILAVAVAALVVQMFWERSGEDRCRVSVVIRNPDSSQWTAFCYGLKMAAEDLDIELSIVGAGSDLAEEEAVLESEIRNGAKAVIVQPIWLEGLEEMLNKIGRRVPVMLAGGAVSQSRETCGFPVMGPDNYGMGAALAEEMLKDYGGNMEGKTLGILTEEEGTEAEESRRRGFQETLYGRGVDTRWSVAGFLDEEEHSLRALPQVDIVAALDDRSLVAAGKCSAANDLHGALVYGIGTSKEAAYYLDTDAVRCLAVPDDFLMGYESLTETVRSMRAHFHKAHGEEISYTLLRRDTLFLEKNQEILFTMSQ